MKNTKTLLAFLILGTLTFVAGIAVYSTMSEIQMMDYVVYGGVGLIVLFSVVIAVKRLQDEKKGLTVDDELSQKIKMKAAANAYLASIYMWTMLFIFTIDSSVSRENLLGFGIIGMGIVYIASWAYQNYKGIDDGNAY